MAINWVDAGNEHHFASKSLSKLVSSYLEPVDPREAITKTFRLVDLLLLSNHIAKANELIVALYKYGESIVPSDPRYSDPPLKYTSFSLENFWLTHGKQYPPPTNVPAFMRCNHGCKTREENLAYEQWGKFREANRTGWMLEHCKLAEPSDPHIWRETDDPRMLAMCCRLLSKNKTQGKFVSQERMKEALEAGMKLFAQPQVCISEWDWKEARTRGEKRHSELLYRRLVVELAIRARELETAAEMLSLGLRIDGFNHGSDLYHYLMIPGVYDVLPLLAKRGKEGNPFHIKEEEAEIIVKKIAETLELRATKGRQWSLAPEKVGWEDLLNRLAKGAWKVNRKEYKQMGVKCWEDILYDPADESEIKEAEEKAGELPKDFKDMMRVAAGFKGGYHLFGGGICGVPLVDGEPEDEFEHFVSDFGHLGFRKDGVTGDVIQIQAGADECDCFRHYIIPPAVWKANIVGREVREGEYQYWHWAPWRGYISSWDSVRDYVASCVEEVEGMIENGKKVDHGNESDQDPDSGDEESDSAEEEEQSSDEWVHVEKE